MARYIATLRGINVSGQKKIKMATLVTVLQSLNLNKVTTYIQSGNVIFDSTEQSKSNIRENIENAIKEHFGFYVATDIRSDREFINIVQQCPFNNINIATDGTKYLTTLLYTKPSKTAIETLIGYVKTPEQLVVQGRIAYLFCPNGYGKTSLSNTFIEKKLDVQATTRNWKTIVKLCELLES